MVEPDRVDEALQLGRSALSPSAAAKNRHRAALFGSAAPLALSEAASRGGHQGIRATLRSAGRSSAAGAALLGAGIAIGFWLRGAVDASEGARPVPALQQGSDGTLPMSSDAPRDREAPMRAGASDARDTGAPGTAVRDTTVPDAAARENEAGPAASVSRRSRRAASPAEKPAPRATVARARTPLQEELELLQRVERAIRANNPAFAVALLDELDTRFPDSRLQEERIAARLIADCRLDRPGAQQRAEKFNAEHPKSVYSERLQSACTPTGRRQTTVRPLSDG